MAFQRIRTIIGKKILRRLLHKTISKTTKEASNQVYKIINGKIINNLKPNAEKVLKIACKYKKRLSIVEKSIGAIYSFITSAGHSTIIDW